MLVLALLVCGCVFAALTGPAVSLRSRTQALQQTFGAVGGVSKAVQVSADWAAFTAALNGSSGAFGFGQPENLTGTQLTESQTEIAQSLARTPLPLAAGDWGGLATRLLPVTAGAGPRTYTQILPRMEVIFRNSLSDHAELASGQYSYSHGALPAGTLAASVTTQTAARFGLHTGSRLQLSIPTGTVSVVITAILRPRDPGAIFWTADSTASTPDLVVDRRSHLGYWVGAILADPDQLAVVQHLFGTAGLALQWEFPLAVSSVNADQAQALTDDLNRALIAPPRLTGHLSPAATETTTSSPLIQVLATFLDTQAEVQTVVLLLFVSLIVVGAAVILLAATMIVVRRSAELTILRSRGASLRQVATTMLRGAVLVSGPAALAGLGLAMLTVSPTGVSSALGWSLAGFTLLAAVAGPPLIAVWAQRPAGPHRTTRTVPLRRLVAEVTACAVSVAGLVVLHDQGLPAGGGVDLFPAAAPVLVAIPVVVIMLRLYPLAVGTLLRLFSRRASATGLIALARAARSSLTGVLPAFALVLALSLAAFAGMVNGAIARGEVAASWQGTGADVVISATQASGPITPAALKAIAAIPGVQRLTGVWNTNWAAPDGQPVTVVAVTPASYAALVASTPFPSVPIAKIETANGAGLSSASPAQVLASPAAAAILGGVHGPAALLTSQLEMGPIRVRVAGTVPDLPVQPAGSAVLIMAMRRLPGAAGAPAVNMVLITGSGISSAVMSAVVARQIPGASTTFRSAALAALAGSPLQHGADLILPITVVAAAGFGLFILILGVAIGSADRSATLARLTIMGHDHGTRLVLLEALPALLAAIASGAACALALPRLVGSSLDLSVFTGSGVPVQVRPGWSSFGLPALVLAVVAIMALTAEARMLRRRGVTCVLRVQ